MKSARRVSILLPALVLALLFSGAASALTPGDIIDKDSDYFADPTEEFVEERSAEALKIVNEILCMIRLSGFDKMMNYDPDGNGAFDAYKAQIDGNECGRERDSASKGGSGAKDQTSGATRPNYLYWTVNSTRTNNDSPQIVHVWFDQTLDGEDGYKEHMRVKTVINEGVSTEKPYGNFTLMFAGYPVDGQGDPDTSNVALKGYLITDVDSRGEPVIRFWETENIRGMAGGVQATIQQAVNGSSGSGTTKVEEQDMGHARKTEYDFVYNQDYFLRTAANGSNVCLNRKDFNVSVWRYGMYNSTGDRQNRNSGFPIKFTSGGKDHHGWVGFYGLWLPETAVVNNGDTVTKQNFSGNQVESENYIVVKSSGKLIKNTRKIMTLGELTAVPVQYDQCQGMQCLRYRVEWNGTDFKTVAKYDDQSNVWGALASGDPARIDLSGLRMQDIGFWSQERGGNYRVRLTCSNNQNNTFDCAATDANQVVLYEQDIVYPGDTVPASLACFESCPNATALNVNGTEPFYACNMHQAVPPASATYVSYAYDSAGVMLSDGGTNVAMTANRTDNYQWGVQSGPMFEPTQANLNKMACDFDSQQTCAWRMWNELEVYYTWETGTNSWNQFTALKDNSGNTLKFEAPLPVQYRKSVGNTTANYFLEYAGFGELQGIPGTCVDRDTGNPVDCGPDTRWVPEFYIRDGSEVCGGSYASGSCSGTPFLVKGLEKEKQMKQSANGCSGMSTSTADLWGESHWQDPAIGNQPVVDAPPKVINGVVQK